MFSLSEKKLNDLVELKNKLTIAKTKIEKVEKNLAGDFICLAIVNKNNNHEKNIHYIRSGEDTPIIERPLQIVIRRQFIKNKRAKDKAWSSLTMRLRE